MNRLARLLFRSLPFALLVTAGAAVAESAIRAEVFKSPDCGCCSKWVEHLRRNGFAVSARDVNDVPAARQSLGMPERYASCHTARIGGYLVEGHVPAEDIRRLLKERPKAIGLAAPGMPLGSPGMESARPQPYDTLLVHADGSASVFAKH